MSKERREQPRYVVRSVVHLGREGAEQATVTLNLSVGGTCVVVREPFGVGERLSLRLELSDGDELALEASVRHSTEVERESRGASEVTYLVGLQFVAVDGAQREALEELMRGAEEELT